MTRVTLLLFGVVALSLAAWDASAPHANPPHVDPPLREETASRVTSFPKDHPDWRVLRETHADATPLRFEHSVHMNADTPRMQTAIQSFAESRRKAGVPASKLGIEQVTAVSGMGGAGAPMKLSCVACHETDDAGRYMKPIVFAQHCQACHSLGQREGQDVPHGKEAAEFLRRVSAESVLTPKPAATEPAAVAPSGGPRRRPTASAPVASTQPQPVTFESEQAMTKSLQERLIAERERLTRAVKPTCIVCHGPQAEPGAVADPMIPDRWLPRSVFSHNAHTFVRCDQCHGRANETLNAPANASPANALTWTGRTADVMLPGIESCRSCHNPQAGVRSDCVTCHSYHQK